MPLVVVFAWTSGTWTQYGADNSHSHFQITKGAITDTPVIKWSFQADGMVETYGPGVADLDGDGHTEVVFGSCAGTVYCLDGATGSLLWSYATGSDAITAPLIKDFDGDGELDVVMGSFDGRVYCFSAAGSVKWSFDTHDQIWSSPTALDVSGDGRPEVFVGSRSDVLYCLDGLTGSVRWAALAGRDIGPSSPALGDVNGDGLPEALVGCENGSLYCFNARNGNLLWTYMTDGTIWSSPGIIDAAGAKRIVFGSGDGWVYCLTGQGSLDWKYNIGLYTNSSPSFADLDRDGSPEIVIGSSDGLLFCFSVDGSVEWTYPINCDVHRGPAIADINGDGWLEVLSSAHYHDTLNCIFGATGSLAWRKIMGFDIHDITVADVDDDGCAEVVFGTQSPTTLWVLDDPHSARDCGTNTSETPGAKGDPSLTPFMGGFRLILPERVFLEINIHDPPGRLVSTIYAGYLGPGTHDFAPALKRGVWFPVIKAEGFCLTGRFIVR
ncbi:MAG: PQQ-binding-like beta-propeller repeat protein [candidate division WOR-3 bacterium]